MMNYKVALVIKTSGLEYDDRVRKEILTIKRLYPMIDFEIFVMLPENKKYDGVTSYGIPYHAVYIPAREKYTSATHLLLKAYQFFSVIKKDLKRFDAVWCADIETFVVALLVKTKKLLWDLHELPSALLGNPIKKYILHIIIKKCKVVIHANEDRLNHLHELGVDFGKSKQFVLRNYPNFEEIDVEYDEKYYNFLKWLNGRRCVYLQGLNELSRAPWESVYSILKTPDLCAVVVGNFDNVVKQQLEKEFGKELNDRIFFTGKIIQLKIPQYVKLCCFSMIFYKNVSPNNYYCEANRFYQSVILGLPVIVGNNPSMRCLVEKYGFGISIDDDGSDVKQISDAIENLLTNYDYFIKKNQRASKELLWDSQEDVMRLIVNNWIF